MTISKTLTTLAAVALVGLMTTSAHAIPFSYTVRTSLNGNALTGGTNTLALPGGETVSLLASTDLTSSVPTTISLADLQLVGTATAVDANVDVVLELTITALGNTQTALFTGVLSLTNFTSTSAVQVFTPDAVPAGTVIGGVPFVFTDFTFAGDTVNNPAVGGFSVTLNAIPEPSTVAMAGIGLLGLAGYGIRRRRKA